MNRAWLALAIGLCCVLVGGMPARPASAAEGPESEIGRWDMLSEDAPIMPVHGALLRSGKVWLAQGSGNNEARFNAGTFETVLWDPADGSFTDIDTPWDVFCAGHTFLADGRLLVAGGTHAYPTPAPDFAGTPKAFTFDPISEQYAQVPDMAIGRWYPSLVTLGDGRAYAVGGFDENVARVEFPEIFRPKLTAWKSKPETAKPWPFYPSLTLMRNGRLFYSGAHVFSSLGVDPGILNVRTSTLQRINAVYPTDWRTQAGTVLLPPAQDQRVMLMGGGSETSGATGTVEFIDLDVANPDFVAGPSMLHPRVHVSSVLLPDRTVLVAGGGGAPEADPVHEAEIYDPATNSWRAVAELHHDRLYHSLALLLPDGRVLIAGNNPAGHEEHSIEIYSPPYLFAGPRPEILAAPGEARYGTTFRIRTTQAARIQYVNLMRPSAVTHSTDNEQRLVNLKQRRLGGGRLELKLTADHEIAPPGWYMLTVTNDEGIPSVATWIRVR